LVNKMDVIAYQKTGLIGGAVSDLDSIDGDALNDQNFAFVMTADKFYVYALNATSGAAESSPDVIAPDTNAGDKRWILQPWLSGTTARDGLLKLATVAMAIAGTDTATAVTPEGLTSRLAAPGEIGGTTPGNGFFDSLEASTLKISSGAAADSILVADADGDLTYTGIAEQTILGRITAGHVDDLSASQVRTLINVADGANAYVHPNHSGDVTSVADGAQTIAAKAVTLSKMADMATASILGRVTAEAGVPEVLSASTVKTLLAIAQADVSGLTTASTPIFAGVSLTAARTYETYVIKKIITKVGIADNTATSFARITTVDEAGNTDAGGYVVFVKGMVSHNVTTSTNSNQAAKSFYATFARVQQAAGSGGNSAVSEIIESASAATNAATRDISTVTLTVLETSEYLNDLQILIDLTGTTVTTGQVIFEITLMWYGFLTVPTITAL